MELTQKLEYGVREFEAVQDGLSANVSVRTDKDGDIESVSGGITDAENSSYMSFSTERKDNGGLRVHISGMDENKIAEVSAFVSSILASVREQ